MNSSTAIVVRRDHFDYEMLMVVAGFLAGYTENTLMAYQQDLRILRGGGADWPVAGGECETTQGAARVDHDRFGS